MLISRVLVAMTLSMMLALSMTACGGSSESEAAGTDPRAWKDPVTLGRSIIWEPGDKEITAHVWESDASDYSICLDDENGIVTDVMLECTNEHMSEYYGKWVSSYDSLDFVLVDDNSDKGTLSNARVGFYGLEDPARAKVFVDIIDSDIFVLNDDGLIDNDETAKRLHSAGYATSAERLDASMEELDKVVDSYLSGNDESASVSK